MYFCIPRDGRARPRRGYDELALDYGAADLDLQVRVASDRELILDVTNDLRERRDNCFLNLQLPLEGIKEMTLGTGQQPTLNPKRKLRHHRTGGLLRAGGWRIRAPRDSVFVWPHRPYFPYPDRSADVPPVGFLRIPLAPVRSQATVRLVVAKR